MGIYLVHVSILLVSASYLIHYLSIPNKFFFKVASVEWYENPIIIRIDTVSKELTNAELFPTVVMCPKQTKSYVDEFGIVKVALELIEFTCNTSKESMPDKCDSYISISQKILDKATYSKIFLVFFPQI
jgi:hypothetical protein